MTKKEERICKRIYNDAKGYNSAQGIESKLTYITILNNNLEFLVYTGVVVRYDINRDRNDNEKIAKITLLFEGFETVNIIID